VSDRQDEYLEALWRLKEQGKDSIEDLLTILDVPFEDGVIENLVLDDLAVCDRENKVAALTEEGFAYAQKLVRKHRLAERLLHDVLRIGTESLETEACTFEHLVAPQMIEGICTLLGHPRKCPHGLPIPEGECCKRSEKMVATSVMYLTSLAVGETGQVAYVNCQDDARLHRLDGLQIKPGVEVTVHQKYPSYVVECEGGMIALDEAIADNIYLWKKPQDDRTGANRDEGKQIEEGKKRRFWQRRRAQVPGAASRW
jgi:DtxR family Mn-dependent transcriptional regulator